jgi:hypothetical protein
MKRILLINTIFLVALISINAQENSTENNTEVKSDTNVSKTEVVVNKKLIAKYDKFMEDGEYVSLWETVKDYSYKEMNGFYQAYKKHEFTDETTYADVKEAYENKRDELNLAEEQTPLKKKNSSELLTKIQ